MVTKKLDGSPVADAVTFKCDNNVNVWRKFRGSEDRPSESEFYAVILERLFAGHTEFARRTYRLEGEKTCLRCNRRLTTPESIEAGIGPKCRSRIRGGR